MMSASILLRNFVFDEGKLHLGRVSELDAALGLHFLSLMSKVDNYIFNLNIYNYVKIKI